jgi:hypothetical protein
MGSTALAVTDKMGNQDQLEQQQGLEATHDNPQVETGEEAAASVQLTQDEQKDLLEVRRRWKEQFRPKRQMFIRRSLRALEVLKNNPYILYNESTADYDSLALILQGTADRKTVDLYQYQDNIYQMLALSFIAALSVDTSKTRYQPVDPKNEEDVIMAKKASLIHAFNERQNGSDGLQQLELLYLWCTGSYFCHVRHIIDRNRAGVKRNPIMAIQPTQILPNRYICPGCGSVVPEDQLASFGKMQCPDCGAPLGEGDFYQSQSMPLPVKVGVEEAPNGMTAFNVYSGLNVDADPDAQDLYESLILDLETEPNIASVRANYPAMYGTIQENQTGGEGSTDGEMDKRARAMVTSPAGTSSMVGQNKGTYSRCWMQPEAFNILDDQTKADNLRSKFPEGVRLVSYSGDIFLQAVPERMMDRWTHCGILKGLGLYPFGAGDAVLDIQERINDAANTIHAYLDRVAYPTVLADAQVIDQASLNGKPMVPGSFTFIDRSDQDGAAATIKLSDAIFQPEFHIDGHIFEYEPALTQLAQAISGVQPQIFGGSDKNVQTAAGQAQALHTATGRLLIYLKRIREERAQRAKNSVLCSVENMDDQMKLVADGDVEGDWKTETVLRNEVTGEFLTYPETDEGFPATYQEIQARLMELLTQGAQSPFVAAILQDPDMVKVVARYILPAEIELPTDAESTRIKIIHHLLWQQQPMMAMNPATGQPMPMPSIQPSADFDDFGLAVELTKRELQRNWQKQKQLPGGFANVLAFLRLCSQFAAQQAAQQQLMLQATQAQGSPNGAGPQQQ